MNVTILGCGPAGLLSAHAAAMLGHEVNIFSQVRKAILPGAMFIHEPIPHLTRSEPDLEIKYVKYGDKEGYARKVYGRSDAPVSWDLFESGLVPGWNMYEAYEKLWELWGTRIVPWDVTSSNVDEIVEKYDKVISTIPAPVLCLGNEWGHDFHSQTIWVKTKTELLEHEDPVIMYSGDPTHAWYRSSQIDGHGSTEYGHFVHGASEGIKPLKTNCNCHPEIMRVGRFGKWQKGVLVHHAFREVLDAL